MQGIDYAYTLQGWLKGVNSINLSPDNDMGNDGKLAAANQYVARDAFGFSLNYFAADYKAINNMVRFPEPMGYFPALQYRPLYNGNISSMAESNDKLSTSGLFGGKTLLYNYKYDQLNRITGMDTYNGFNTASNNWNGMVKLDQLQEKVSYNGNGNIQGYLRHGHLNGSNLVMDSLSYKYDTLNQRRNRLLRVVDNVPATRYGTYADLDPQTKPINYVYDRIGNLISDSAENINSIKWNVYGKISEINRTSTTGNTVTKIVYTYDASGNRISSVTTRSGTSNLDYVWYVRDAQGNAIAVYKATGTSTLSTLTPVLAERYIYGSSRLGSYNEEISVTGGAAALSGINSFSNRRGLKSYELSNHLGNVLATISDKKIGVPSAGNSSLIGYYTADVTNATSYYPFGSIMPGRSWSNGGKYRYGFNGKENDNNVKNADGTQQDYGMRIYDPRVGRFLSMDPISSDFPFYSLYQFAGNKPIWAIDLDGMEEWMQTQANLQKQRAILQLKSLSKPKATVRAYNPDDKTFAQNWRDSKNIVGKISYDIINGLYTLPQQMTADIRNEDYIYNIGGNYYNARGIFDETQRVRNFNNGATALVPGSLASKTEGLLAKYTDNILIGIEKRVTQQLASKTKNLVSINTIEGDVMIFSSKIGDEVIEGITNFKVSDGKLILNQLHLEGSSAGQVGREALWEMAKDLGKQHKVTEVIIQGGKRTTGKYKGQVPSQIKIKVD